MFRTDGDGNVGNMFSNGNPGMGLPATQVDADWLNDVQESLCQAIEAAGITLIEGSGTQLRDAIKALCLQPVALTYLTNTDFTGSWADSSGDRKMSCALGPGGRVFLEGIASRINNTTTQVGTLPAGFRPNNSVWFAVPDRHDGSLVTVQIGPTGGIYPQNLVNASARLDFSGISFMQTVTLAP